MTNWLENKPMLNPDFAACEITICQEKVFKHCPPYPGPKCHSLTVFVSNPIVCKSVKSTLTKANHTFDIGDHQNILFHSVWAIFVIKHNIWRTHHI